jgi:hypothetical protein
MLVTEQTIQTKKNILKWLSTRHHVESVLVERGTEQCRIKLLTFF